MQTGPIFQNGPKRILTGEAVVTVRNVLQSAMIVVMALLIWVGTAIFGSTTIRMAVPLYGLTLLLVLLWAAKLVVAEAVSWKKSLVHIPVAGFALYALLRYCTSPLEYESRLELFLVVICTLVYFAAASNFYHSRERKILVGAILILGVAEAMFAIGQFATNAPTLFGFNRPAIFVNRGSGTFFCPNHLAGLLEMVLCMVVARLAIHKSSKLSLQKLAMEKIFLTFGALVILVGLLTTLSRGGWMAVIVGVMLLLPLGGWHWSRLWPRFAVTAGALGLLVFLAFNLEGINTRVVHSYFMVKGNETNSVNLNVSTLGPRIKIWGATVEMIRDRPVWGSGAGTWQWFYPKHRPDKLASNPEFPHNDILNLMSDYGLVGFILLASGILFFYRHALKLIQFERSAEERAFAVGSIMAVTAILVHSLVDFNMHIPCNAVLLMVLVGFTVAIEREPKGQERVLITRVPRLGLAASLLSVSIVLGWFAGRTALSDQSSARGEYAARDFLYEPALAHFREAIRISPNNPYPYIHMGHVYFSMSQWRALPSRQKERQEFARQAVEAYSKALALNPYAVDVLVRLAQAYEIVGEGEQVVKSCQRAIELDPISPVAYIFLGRYYMHQDDLDRAEEVFKKAAEYGYARDDTTAAVNLELIRSLRTKPAP